VDERSSPAVFLDRDGTLMRDVDYCGDPKNVEVFAHAPEALRALKNRGYKLFIITNQSGIRRGYFTDEQYRTVEREVLRQLGVDLIEATYYCPHGPDDICGCRKPEPGLVSQAVHDYNLDLTRSFFVGDKDGDIQCGRQAGVKTILVHTGYGQYADQSAADFVASDLSAAANWIASVSNE
jgi:D-glycero-D-manno-heptose 1,7-bisphosphate phosphatase